MKLLLLLHTPMKPLPPLPFLLLPTPCFFVPPTACRERRTDAILISIPGRYQYQFPERFSNPPASHPSSRLPALYPVSPARSWTDRIPIIRPPVYPPIQSIKHQSSHLYITNAELEHRTGINVRIPDHGSRRSKKNSFSVCLFSRLPMGGEYERYQGTYSWSSSDHCGSLTKIGSAGHGVSEMRYGAGARVSNPLALVLNILYTMGVRQTGHARISGHGHIAPFLLCNTIAPEPRISIHSGEKIIITCIGAVGNTNTVLPLSLDWLTGGLFLDALLCSVLQERRGGFETAHSALERSTECEASFKLYDFRQLAVCGTKRWEGDKMI
ncbi:hypothetical protein K438DRAFT_1936290 [Mycena galopus ATCC 62051]|nr:hypothetical protein K438DRAFT_1936290 [Mycena galopus ATCC 62051]